jgi:hypothetical protein
MDILRDRQIKEILDLDNFFKRIVIQRTKAGVQDYVQNKTEPQILNNTVADNNKKTVNDFLNDLNNLYVVLTIFNQDVEEFIGTLRNKNRGEYKKFMNLINIVKPFQIWTQLMDEYINPSINLITKENILNNLQKLLPFLSGVNNLLLGDVKDMSYIVANDTDLPPDELGISYPVISEQQLYGYFFDGNYYDEDNDDARKIMKLIKEIKALEILPNMIECLAFYRCVYNAITNNKLKPLSKSEIAYEIAQVLNEIYVSADYAYRDVVINKISEKIGGVDFPELAPYFRAGFNKFKKYFDELDALAGIDAAGIEVMPEFIGEYEPVAPATPEAYALDMAEPVEPDDFVLPELYEGRAPRREAVLPRRQGEPAEEEKDDDVRYRRQRGDFAGRGRKRVSRKTRKSYIKTSQNPINFDDEDNDLFFD